MEWLRDFNSNYASAVQAFTPFVIGVIAWLYYKLYEESKLKEGDAASYVKPIFWTLGTKYKIFAVPKFEISDNESCGYKYLSQNSRPDQWKKLIEVRKSFLGLRHEIVPINNNDILEVIISRNGKERNKVISFNK